MSFLPLFLFFIGICQPFTAGRTSAESSESILNLTKRWIVYLEENMYNVLKLPHTNLVKDLFQLLGNIMNTYWECGLNIVKKLPSPKIVDKSASHRNAFCGIIVINKDVLVSTRWYLVVERNFHIWVDFLQFNLTDYDTGCEMAALEFFQFSNGKWSRPPGWKYCGQRLPWKIITKESMAMIEFERNYPVTPSIVVQYSACEPFYYQRYSFLLILSGSLKHLTNALGKCMVKYYVKYMPQKWSIYVGPGYTIRYLNIRHANLTGKIDIYDGPHDRIIIYKNNIAHISTVESIKKVNLSTKFMTSNINFQILSKIRGRHSKFLILFHRIFSSDKKLLPLNSVTTITHVAGLMHKVFHFQSLNGDYPKLALTIRKFHGLNDGACSYGGFLLRQPSLIGSNTDRNHGPYCKDSSLR